jgi:hypothetical protein
MTQTLYAHLNKIKKFLKKNRKKMELINAYVSD